jgi:hypothetical protein
LRQRLAARAKALGVRHRLGGHAARRPVGEHEVDERARRRRVVGLAGRFVARRLLVLARLHA